MRLLVTGAGGMLAQAVAHVGRAASHELVLFDRAALDVTDADAVERAIAQVRPHAVVQCAAYTRVDDAEQNEDAANLVNVLGARNVAQACSRVGAVFVYPSTDYVFDGNGRRPYEPSDNPAPVNAYGRSKLAGEAEAARVRRHLIVRSSWLYGAGGRNFVATILQRARAGAPLRIVQDQVGSPTWSHHLAKTLFALIELNAPSGVYHAANAGQATWHDLGKAAIELSGLEAEVTPVSTAEFPRPAPRPAYSVLDCTRTVAVVGPIAHWKVALAAALEAGVE